MNNSQKLGWLVCLCLGVGIGFVTFSRSDEINELMDENNRLRRALLVKENLKKSESNIRENRFGGGFAPPPVGNEIHLSSLSDVEAFADENRYDLMFSTPEAKKLLEDSVNHFSEKNRPNVEREYRPLFEEFGIGEEDSEALVDHLVKVEKGAREAEQYLLQLQNARFAYDRKMKNLLSEEDYESYRDFEERKPATREFTVFEDYLAQQGVDSFSESDKEKIVSLIQGAGAYTSESWLDPYGDEPRPQVGDWNVYQGTQERMDQLSNAANHVIANAEQSELPGEQVEALIGYYSERYQGLQTHAENLGHRLENPDLYQEIFQIPRHERQAYIDELAERGELPARFSSQESDK